MKKTTFLMIAFVALATFTANAKVWRVNNRPNVQADFTTLQAAITGAANGDTLYLEGSPTAYGNGTFNKKLIVYGPGYFLAENDTTQAYKSSAQVGQLIFNTGSQGSETNGLYITYSFNGASFSVITINTSNITLRRNRINCNQYQPYQNYYGYAIYINGSYSNIHIEQNWINSDGTGDNRGIQINGVPDSCIIRNNYIRGLDYSLVVNGDVNNTVVFANNVVSGSIFTYYTAIINNILTSGTYYNGTEDFVSNNVCNSTQFAASPNPNLLNVDMASVFEDFANPTAMDKNFKLKPDSPALTAGIDGTECGMFSIAMNSKPYVLSGLPEIPSIFGATMQTVGTTVLPVNIKAKSNN